MARAHAFVFDAYGTLFDVHSVKEEFVLVSSNSFDVMGAKAYGFQVAWVNRIHAQADALGIAPDFVLSRLYELPQVFPAQ